ncbi:peptidoglycan editing factor PgeF [Chloroflexota bacterium]
MLRRNDDGLVSYQFESLDGLDLVHGVFTRLGGVSRGQFATLNVGHTVGDEPSAVRENHSRIYRALSLSAGRVTTAYQVHSNRVVVVDHKNGGHVVARADGLITRAGGLALMLRFADCQPILLYDKQHNALGLIHAGWRGVAQAIARRAVETMADAFGTRPTDLIANLGPAIGPCCYMVGQDVAAAMGYALPDWRKVMTQDGDRWLFDLPAANEQQLRAAGVTTIEQAHLCTACHTDEFFSHRGEGGRTGRFGVVVFMPEGTEIVREEDATALSAVPKDSADEEAATLEPPGLPTFVEILKGKQ